MTELADILDEILKFMSGKVEGGLKIDTTGDVTEDNYRTLCVLHFNVQLEHGQFAAAKASWDAALVARASWETNLTLRWVQLDKPTGMRRVQAWGHLYDYETMQEDKADGVAVDATEEDQLVGELNSHFSNEIFSRDTLRVLAATPNPRCTDFKKTTQVLPSVRTMVENVWPVALTPGVTPKHYRIYQRLSEWTHGAPAGLSIMVEKQADDRWKINKVSADWLGWSLGLLTRSMIHTAISVSEFMFPADVAQLSSLKVRLETVFPE